MAAATRPRPITSIPRPLSFSAESRASSGYPPARPPSPPESSEARDTPSPAPGVAATAEGATGRDDTTVAVPNPLDDDAAAAGRPQ